MADTISNPTMEPLFFSVDPMSLILSQNSNTHQLSLLLDGFSGFERGPRYEDYARLRESKLRMKRDYQTILEEEEARFYEDEPRKKQVRFEGSSVILGEEDKFSSEKKKQTRFGFGVSPMANSRKGSSSLAQSVPDFSAVIRKENRRPVNSNMLPITPPPSKTKNVSVLMGSASSTRGSKSASTVGEKTSKGMARKSYASVEDLKKISVAAASAINGSGGGRKAVGVGRSILGFRKIY